MSKPINRIVGKRLQSTTMVFWRHHRKQFFHVFVIILVQLFLLVFLYQQINAQCSMFCNAVTNVALDQDCESQIWYDMILQDPYNPLVCAPSSPPSFQVIVMNQAGTTLNTSPYVTAANIGQSLMVKVRHLPTMNSCWGQINIQDNLAPVLQCPSDIAIACSQNADPALTGHPYANDCSFFQVNYDDQLQNFPCQATLQRITRTWRATDAFGQQSTCTQNIFIKRPELDAVSFPPNQDGIQSPAISCDSFALHPDWTDPNFTGFPTIAGQNFSNGGICTIGYTFQDQTVPLCENSFKILRKWTLVDWCTSQIKEAYQIIQVEDTTAPDFNLPDSLSVSTTSDVNCSANVQLPAVQIFDNCGTQFTVDIFTPFGTLHQNGGMVFDVPQGVHQIAYRVVDDCGNIARDTMLLVVYDGTPPTGICRTSTQVSLSSNGTAIIPAHLFDEGSYDNCCLESFSIRPEGSNAPFASQQVIDCNQIDSTSIFTVKIEDCNGNANYCTVEVRLKESLPPIIQCPNNITLTCFEDPTQISLTGIAQSWDNCSIDSLWYKDNDTRGLCHTGTIVRTWKTSDQSGNTSSCQQTITQVLSGQIAVQFPNDFTTYECLNDPQVLHPDSLGMRPGISGQSCGQIGKNYTDDIFHTQSTGCYFIRRTWKVIDWCRFDGSQGADGWFEDVQTITMLDTIAPVINCPSLIELDLTGSTCEDTVIIPQPFASDNCSNQIQYSLTGELGTSWQVYNASPGIYQVSVTADDLCGNRSVCNSQVLLKDAKPPVALCKQGLIIDLPATMELDVLASEFNYQSYDNCSTDQELEFTIQRSSLFTGDPPNDNTLHVDCDDLLSHVLVNLWVKDAAGNSSTCQTLLTVQDNFTHCPNGNNKYVINGKMESSNRVPVEDTEVMLYENGNMQQYALANHLGHYQFQPIPAQGTREIIPFNDFNFLQGISTRDLVLLQRHFRGFQTFNSPELYIAGDINNDQIIDSLDIVFLRKALLRNQAGFPNNTSWRFIPQDYVFRNTNPLLDTFPEKVTFVPMQSDQQIDFLAIKVGDIDKSISNHAQGPVSNRSEKQFMLEQSGHDTWQLKSNFSGYLWAFQLELPIQASLPSMFFSERLSIGEIMVVENKETLLLQWTSPLPIKVSLGTLLGELTSKISLTTSSTISNQEICTGDDMPILENLTVKIIEKKAEKHFPDLVYPNPGPGHFYFNKSLIRKSPELVKVLDTTGKLVRAIRVQSVYYEPISLDLTDLPAGMYWLDIQFANYNPVKIAVFKW